MGVLTGALIIVGLLLLVYLVWVAATSRTFLAVSMTLLMAALVEVVLVAAILGVAGLIPWWAALLLGVAGSSVFFLALVPAARFGLTRLERRLKAEYPFHWKDGESACKSEVERLARLPETTVEAKLVESELRRLAAKAHAQRYSHESADEPCPAFDTAFQVGYWESLKAAGFEAKHSQTPEPPTTEPGA